MRKRIIGGDLELPSQVNAHLMQPKFENNNARQYKHQLPEWQTDPWTGLMDQLSAPLEDALVTNVIDVNAVSPPCLSNAVLMDPLKEAETHEARLEELLQGELWEASFIDLGARGADRPREG